MRVAFPYPVLAMSDVALRVESVRVDNVPVELGLISDSHRVVALHHVNKQDWRVLTLAVTVTVGGEELAAGPWEDPMCFAVMNNRRTKFTGTVGLQLADPGRWAGELELYKDDHVGRTDIGAHVVATVRGVAGRIIGSAEKTWTADFEARRPTRERTVRMVWRDFTDAAEPQLHPYRHDPWLVEAAGDEPTIYLNSSVEGFRAVLNGTGAGVEQAVRETLATQIATEAWVGMFNAALYEGTVDGGDPQWPGGWHEDVLRRMLPDVFPDLSPDDALSEAVTRRTEGRGGGDLQMRIIHGAATQAMRSKKVASALRTLRRIDGGTKGTNS